MRTSNFKDCLQKHDDSSAKSVSTCRIVNNKHRKDMLPWMLTSRPNDDESIPDGSFSSCSTNSTLTNSSHHRYQYEWDIVNFDFAAVDDFTDDDYECDNFEFAHTETIQEKDEVPTQQSYSTNSRERRSKQVQFNAIHDEYNENLPSSNSVDESMESVVHSIDDPSCFNESWPLNISLYEAGWWTIEEEEQMHREVVTQCKFLRVKHRELLKSMFRCYDDIAKGYTTARYVVPQFKLEIMNWISIELSSCVSITETTSSSSSAACVRGLESFVSRRVSRERHRVIRTIIDCYRTALRGRNIQNAVIGDIDEHVRVQSLKLTYATRVFAHLLALADHQDVVST